MRRKILFAVMALLTMTTGNIWAQGGTTTDGSTAYVIYDTENTTLHFLCANAGDVTDNKISIEGKEIALTAANSWSGDKVLKTGNKYPGWSESQITASSINNATRIVIHESFSVARPTSCYGWFNSFKKISAQNGTTTIEGIEHLNTSEVTDMGYMFYSCSSLTSLDLSKFNTEKVTNMEYMFSGCNSLPSLDLSKFNTSSVKNMEFMFTNCKKLSSLDLNNFNTGDVENMRSMFGGCNVMSSLIFGENFTTSKVTDMGYMFSGCNNLTSLDLSKFNTEKVTDMSYMFSGYNSLSSLDLSKFNTSSVTNMNSMFKRCNKLTSLDLSNFNTEKVTNMGYMFYSCTSLTSLVLGNFTTSSVTDMSSMFNDCSKLTSLDLSKFNTTNVTTMANMFDGCQGLTSLTFGDNFNTEKVTKMTSMFYGCSKLTSLDLSKFNTTNVDYMLSMFYNCSSLTSLDLSNFNTGKVTTMANMFYGCSSLTSLTFGDIFNTSSVTNMNNMFNGCSSLRLLDLSKATSLNFSNMIGSISNRPLTYVPTGTVTANRENVVVDNGCAHLVINYGATPNNQLLLSAPYGFTAQKITINRKFTKDKPYTLCLPFAVTNTATYGAFYKYSDYNDGKVKFTKVETTEANKPYLFVPSATLGGSIVIDGETAVGVQTAETSEDGEFIGVYRKMTFTGEEASEGVCYGWTDNSDGKGEFRRAGNGASVDACRAYIKLSAASGGSSAPARLSIELDGGATAISTLSTAGSGADDGTDAPVYNLQGQRVSGSYNGVVIKNGKKMIVK